MVLCTPLEKSAFVSAGSGKGSEDCAVGCRPTVGFAALYWDYRVPCVIPLPGIHVGAKLFSWILPRLLLDG